MTNPTPTVTPDAIRGPASLSAEIDALFRLRTRVLTSVHTLAGKDLAGWCPLSSRWCHANLLLRLAARHAEFERWAA